MITVSASTAACECGFSCMNRQKTNIQASLSQSLLDDVLQISINGCELKQFQCWKEFEALDGYHKWSQAHSMEQSPI